MSGMSDMAGSERLFNALDRIQDKQDKNHTEIVQRITRLETLQHRPEDCRKSFLSREEFAKYLSDVLREKEKHEKFTTGKRLIDYAIKGAVAAGLIYGGSQIGKP